MEMKESLDGEKVCGSGVHIPTYMQAHYTDETQL